MFLGSPSFGTPTRLSPLCQGLPVLPLLLSFPRSPPTSSCPYIRTHLDSAVSQPRGLQGPQLGAVLAQGRPGRQHPAECPLMLAPLPSSLQGRCRAGCSWGRCGDLAPSVGTLILGWQSWEDRATWGEALTSLCQAQKSPEAVIDRQETLKTGSTMEVASLPEPSWLPGAAGNRTPLPLHSKGLHKPVPVFACSCCPWAKEV